MWQSTDYLSEGLEKDEHLAAKRRIVERNRQRPLHVHKHFVEQQQCGCPIQHPPQHFATRCCPLLILLPHHSVQVLFSQLPGDLSPWRANQRSSIGYLPPACRIKLNPGEHSHASHASLLRKACEFR